jgi:uncharacterized protein (DUF885 family)
MATQTAIGRDNYIFFLKNVALLPYTPEQLLEIGHQEWARAVSFQTYEEHRNTGSPELPISKTIEEQVSREEADEQAVRRYMEEKNILSVPSWMQHYLHRPMPAYTKALLDLEPGEADDFTSPTRLKENGIRYVTPPGPDLGYFMLADAKEPRTGIVHEGVPGHYFQLALSWAHPDPIRRHYYDSSANEGLGFYAEEMMQEAGLFDNSPPQSRDHRQLHALASVACRSRCKTGSWPVHHRAGCGLPPHHGSDGFENRTGRSLVLRNRARSGNLLSDREDPDHEFPCRGAPSATRQVQLARIPRLRLA